MTKKPLSSFEQRIAQWIEGGFARLFAGRLHAQEVAIRLARAMEDNALPDSDGILLAPNIFTVHLHPEDYLALNEAQPGLAAALVEGIVELATRVGMRLRETPVVELTPDQSVSAYTIVVEADHVRGANPATQVLEPIGAPPDALLAPRNAQLIVQQKRQIPLTRSVINIGRRHDNHIVIDDPRVSRNHAQLRLRFGHYVLFDLGSKAGTYVNNQRVVECILRPGDVISLAGVMLVYIEDEAGIDIADTHSDTQLRSPLAADGDPTL